MFHAPLLPLAAHKLLLTQGPLYIVSVYAKAVMSQLVHVKSAQYH